MKTGYIILGHGSRASEANETLQHITGIVKEKLAEDTVIGAFMGFSQPSLEQAAEELVNNGCGKVIIMPFFLYKGIHMQEDIPAKVKKLEEKFGSKVSFSITNHLGVDSRLAEIILDRIKEVN